jgi:hypothetical protein
LKKVKNFPAKGLQFFLKDDSMASPLRRGVDLCKLVSLGIFNVFAADYPPRGGCRILEENNKIA